MLSLSRLNMAMPVVVKCKQVKLSCLEVDMVPPLNLWASRDLLSIV